MFDDVIPDMEANKNLEPLVTKLFIEVENSTFHSLSHHRIVSKIYKCLKI